MRGADDIEPWRRLPGCVVALIAALAVVLTGCSAGPLPRPTPSPLASTPSVSVPDDGATLAEFGFTHGPVTAWSLPQATALTGKVDQPNQVTMVITSPGAEDVVRYLDRALPTAGFTIEHHREDGTSSALIATGYGWRGSIVGASNDRTVLTLQQVA